MKFKRLFTDDESAVSPVIGVILMVAITVILAAVIATFVLGLGDQVSSTAPQASFDTDYNSSGNQLNFTHASGESIPADQLNLTTDNESVGTDNYWYALSSSVEESDDVTAGDRANITAYDSDTVRIVFTDQEGASTATLRTWEGPDV